MQIITESSDLRELAEKIYSLKEFFVLAQDRLIPRDQSFDFRPEAHQLLAGRLLAELKRNLILCFDVGTGKTASFITLAMPEIQKMRRMREMWKNKTQGYRQKKIYIICPKASKKAFFDDFCRPFFGFVSENERYELDNSPPQKYEELMKAFMSRVKQFIRFITYQKFVNLYFEGIFEIGHRTLQTLEDALAAGTIRPSRKLMDECALMCLDEMHQMYDSEGKNTYGFAVQHAARTIKDLRIIGLSATLMTSSPAEIIDTLNIIDPSFNFVRSDFFETVIDKSGVRYARCKPGKEIEIAKHLAPTVVYFSRSIDETYPNTLYSGEIPSTGFRWLKVRQCPMSAFQETAYRAKLSAYGIQAEETMDENMESAAADSARRVEYMASTMVVPSFDGKTPVYKIGEIEAMANTGEAGQNFSFVRKGVPVITGEALKMPELFKYSAVYATFMQDVLEKCKLGLGEKILAYNPVIAVGGILQIECILQENGIIRFGDSPNGKTICMRCGVDMSHHDLGKEGHEFTPARFATVSGSVNNVHRNLIINVYNSHRNVHGQELMIVLLSKVAALAVTFLCTRHIYVLNVIHSFPTLRQLVGRGTRMHSHDNLPPEKRDVTVHVLASVAGTLADPEPVVSEQLERYRIREVTDISIKRIDHYAKVFSMTCPINYNTAYQAALVEQYKKCVPAETDRPLEPGEVLCPPECDYMTCGYSCEYHPSAEKNKELENGVGLGTITYQQRYVEEEIQFITLAIKHLFVNVCPIWNIDNLFSVVMANANGAIPWNTKLLNRENFNSALSSIMDQSNANMIAIKAHGSLVNSQGKQCVIRRLEGGVAAIVPIARRTVSMFNLFDEADIADPPLTVKIDNFLSRMISSKNNLAQAFAAIETVVHKRGFVFQDLINHFDQISWHIQNVETQNTRLSMYVLELVFRMCISTMIHSQNVDQEPIVGNLNSDTSGPNPELEVSSRDRELKKYKLSPQAILTVLGALDFAGSLIRLSDLPAKYRERVERKLRFSQHIPQSDPYTEFIKNRLARVTGLIENSSTFFRRAERFTGANTPIGYVFGPHMILAIPSTTAIARHKTSELREEPKKPGNIPAERKDEVLSVHGISAIVSFDFDEWIEIEQSKPTAETEGTVVGIYSKSQSFQSKLWAATFKLRIPSTHMPSTDDKRFVHKGIVCYNMDQVKLYDMAAKLGIMNKTRGKLHLCWEIERALLGKAFEAIRKNSEERWVYSIFEQDPILR